MEFYIERTSAILIRPYDKAYQEGKIQINSLEELMALSKN